MPQKGIMTLCQKKDRARIAELEQILDKSAKRQHRLMATVYGKVELDAQEQSAQTILARSKGGKLGRG